MKNQIINEILYTAVKIPKVHSIKDTKIYDLCLAIKEAGHDVTLFAAEPYKSVVEEDCLFHIVWGKCRLDRFFVKQTVI